MLKTLRAAIAELADLEHLKRQLVTHHPTGMAVEQALQCAQCRRLLDRSARIRAALPAAVHHTMTLITAVKEPMNTARWFWNALMEWLGARRPVTTRPLRDIPPNKRSGEFL